MYRIVINKRIYSVTGKQLKAIRSKGITFSFTITIGGI